MVDQADTTLLEMRGISKRFPGIAALSNVDFSVRAGEIHALLGQNGAGKSTLMKILAGVYPIEAGEMRIDGKPVTFSHPRDALRLGIGTVYQDLSLVPALSVAHNIFLGREAGGGFVIDENATLKQAARVLDQLGIKHIDLRARVSSLPLAQQQLVEIAKVFSNQPRILVLDEPTAALAEEETTLLFGLLKGLREQGIAIIFISHRFKEVIEHCDRATVLRNGTLVKTVDLAGVTEDELVELTIGERLEAFFHYKSHPRTSEEVVLDVENLFIGHTVHGVNFRLHRGEIIGVTGLLGAGQNELARALFGIEDHVSGTIRLRGREVNIHSPQAALELGIGLLTEHRKREGLVLDMTVKENITLPSLNIFQRAMLFIDNMREQQAAQSFIDQLHIKVVSPGVQVNTLSGGNQQKAILAKWLLRNLDILIFIAPTQGIDVGAKAEIYQQLSELSREGKAILIVSEDLVEILGISDRIMILYNGQLVQMIERAGATEELLLSAIEGTIHDQDTAA